MASNNGGPAFPIVVPGFLHCDGSCEAPLISDQGMTVRQWYKGLAMQGLVACGDVHHTIDSVNQQEGIHGEDAARSMAKFLAKMAGLFADAMLAEDKAFEERKEATP